MVSINERDMADALASEIDILKGVQRNLFGDPVFVIDKEGLFLCLEIDESSYRALTFLRERKMVVLNRLSNLIDKCSS